MTRPPVAAVMTRLARAIEAHDLPAVEKIAQSRRDKAFQVLIGTLLSARTQDATTDAASARLFRVAPTPARVAALSVERIEGLGGRGGGLAVEGEDRLHEAGAILTGAVSRGLPHRLSAAHRLP